MKRILVSCTLVASVLAYACSSKTDGAKNDATTNPDNTLPTEDADAGGSSSGGEDGGGPDTSVPPGGEDPSGNPILLGAPRTVRTFTPAGGTPHFVDGPAWSPAKNMLFVSLPFAQNASGGKGILTQFKIDGTSYTELRAGDKVMFGAVGNTVDKDGNLFSAELKAITRTTAAGTAPEIVATGWSTGVEGAPITPFDAPNDLVVLDDGTIFFTDPGYGVDPRPQMGRLFKIKPGDAFATVVASYDYNPSPNGIALSKDQKSLFVGFTSPGEGTLPFVRKYVIKDDRSLEDAGKFLETPVGSDPDGLAMDENDNLYVAMKGGIGVYKANGAQGVPYGNDVNKVPQTKIDGDPTGLSFGGPDRKSLFVTTTNGKALELKTKVAGLLH
ncbi:MAG: SMP-30/gluconolactonase/LRE family protein [Deltaproteobacteria bacterium]|nr:SMP-30/gluconolactonase/LRE family protein [Deltaproteobacteria bacterium]